MNEEMQAHLTHMTNSNKPTLNEINSKIFEATERYLATNKIKSHSKQNHISSDTAHAQAADVSYKPKTTACSLCSTKDKRDQSHSTANCPKFPDV